MYKTTSKFPATCRIQSHLFRECDPKITPSTHSTSWTKTRQLSTPPNPRLAKHLEKTKYFCFLSYTNIFDRVILGVLLTATQALRSQCPASASTLNVPLSGVSGFFFNGSSAKQSSSDCLIFSATITEGNSAPRRKRLSSEAHFKRHNHQEKEMYPKPAYFKTKE